MIKEKIKIPIYFGELVIIAHNDFKEATKDYKLNWAEGSFDGTLGYSIVVLHTKTNRTHYIVLLKEETTHSVIAHEALHTTHRILDNINHSPSFTDDEPECYLHDWIIEQIYKVVKKHDIKVSI